MFAKLVNWFHDREKRKIRDSLPKLDWKELYAQLEDIVADNSVYIETRHNGLLSIESREANNPESDIVALVITPAKEGVPVWETEAPAKEIVASISKKIGRPCALLLSRDYTNFVGYYAYVR